ncbi:hypothetical protein MNBD_BACTEROID01-1138 [hydrothermal vent metagenome]|uniref:Uncharacterized protein n=1 Tax=hydrothermal vent metagenome TaxID=652676 RepID=A0A3B0UMG9_9ZZZZ
MKKIINLIEATLLIFILSTISTYAQEIEKVVGTVGGERLGNDGIVICVLGTQACMPVRIDKNMTVQYNGKETKLTDLPFALYLEADIEVGKNIIKTISVDEKKTVICFADHKKGDDEKLSRLLKKIDGVENFKLYPESNQVLIDYNPKKIAYRVLERKIKNEGFILE